MDIACRGGFCISFWKAESKQGAFHCSGESNNKSRIGGVLSICTHFATSPLERRLLTPPLMWEPWSIWWELEGCPPSPPLMWGPWSTKRGTHQSPAGSGPAPSLGVVYGPSGASLGWVEIPSDISGGAMTPSWERTASRDAQKPLDEGPARHWSWPVRTHTGCSTGLSPFSPQLA